LFLVLLLLFLCSSTLFLVMLLYFMCSWFYYSYSFAFSFDVLIPFLMGTFVGYVTLISLFLIINLQDLWVHSKSVQNLLFHRFILFKYECHALFKHGSQMNDFRV
jgi:hypothetical protein